MRNWLLRTRPFLAYVPLIVAMVWWAAGQRRLPLVVLSALWMAGIFLWTLLERVSHRAMHVQTGIAMINRFQDTAHLRHHRQPDDLEHSVVRLSASLPLVLVFLGIARAVSGDGVDATLVICGLLTGYLVYEFVHLATHANRRIPGLRYMQRYHERHHFGNSDRSYGVTTPMWDWLFGSLPRGGEPRQT